MPDIDPELHKHREVWFDPLHPDADQAARAVECLGELPGITHCTRLGPHAIAVEYDLQQVCLYDIEQRLTDAGLHLDGSLMARIKRALFHYTDETQRANMGWHHDIKSTSEIFINRYQHLPHGCRDARPPHWRKYL